MTTRRDFLKSLACLSAAAMAPTLTIANKEREALGVGWNTPWTKTQLFVRRIFTPLRKYRAIHGAAESGGERRPWKLFASRVKYGIRTRGFYKKPGRPI